MHPTYSTFFQFPMPGKIPKELYLRNNKPVPKEGMTTLQITGGSKTKIEFGVYVKNSVLRYVVALRT